MRVLFFHVDPSLFFIPHSFFDIDVLSLCVLYYAFLFGLSVSFVFVFYS
jgi:hypothetical protein